MTGVIVVHGVADQKPGETVRAVSGLVASKAGWTERTVWRSAGQSSAAHVFPVTTLDGQTAAGNETKFYELYWADLSRPGGDGSQPSSVV